MKLTLCGSPLQGTWTALASTEPGDRCSEGVNPRNLGVPLTQHPSDSFPISMCAGPPQNRGRERDRESEIKSLACRESTSSAPGNTWIFQLLVGRAGWRGKRCRWQTVKVIRTPELPQSPQTGPHFDRSSPRLH